MDTSTDLVAIARFAHSYKHDSRGQCTPCHEGTTWMTDVVCCFKEGRADTPAKINILLK
ncbi:hypothetical protein PENSPDRAFT_690914 [Peniophora sp. CONT]|nr:hypothetical protein PENSPDRAFT_690914 [Peniophora sp. CONT]